MKVVHEWLKEYLGDTTPTPEEVENLLTFHAFEIEGIEKVGDQTVIDVDVLPNRSSDCLCHRGIARELASVLGVSLLHDPLREELTLPSTDKLEATLSDTHACRRFGLALVEGVEVGESPQWLRDRLEALGQRSINNVVDATNYVMLSLGQPLHAYDAAKWDVKDGKYIFGVRAAEAGEKITTLTDDEYELTPDVQVIVDGSTDTPAGIAGIKGGKYAEVTNDTTTIILEAANFDPVLTRKASQSLKLQTDASKRFENEPSRELVPYALRATAQLIADIAGGKIEGWHDVYPAQQESVEVVVHPERANALLGLSLEKEMMRDIFVHIGAEVVEAEGNFVVKGPWERTDLLIEEDFIEEVGRIHGYTHVESVVPEATSLREINARHYYSEKVRTVLIAHGFSEVITSSFRKKDEIELLNSLASDKGCMRSSLAKNITEVLDKNIPLLDLLGLKDIRVFEIGTVFKKEDGVAEHVSLALGVRTKPTGSTPNDDAVIKATIEALEGVLGNEVQVTLENGVAECDFTKLVAALPEPESYEAFQKEEDVQYVPFSLYPSVSRDIALWTTEGVTADSVEKVLNEEAGELRVRTTLFDEFSKDGRTSYAFRLVFQSNEKTLTDAEVNAVMDRIYSAVRERGWEAR